jgi:hypothetical protein
LFISTRISSQNKRTGNLGEFESAEIRIEDFEGGTGTVYTYCDDENDGKRKPSTSIEVSQGDRRKVRKKNINGNFSEDPRRFLIVLEM